MAEGTNAKTHVEGHGPRKWRPSWKAVSTLAAGVALAFVLLVSFLFPGGLPGFSKAYADQASVYGLLVSVIGFALTLWALWETERVNAEARGRVEAAAEAARDAVHQAQEESRKVLKGAALRLLASDISTLQRIAKEAQDCIVRKEWRRVIDRCTEAKRLALLHQHSPHLGNEEQKGLVRAAADLTAIVTFLRDNSVREGAANQGFTINQKAALETLVNLAASVEGRLLAESFKP